MVKLWASISTTVRVEGFTRDGLFHFDLDTASDRSLVQKEFKLTDFPIAVSCGTKPGAAISRRQVLILVALRLGGMPVYKLFQGYLDPSSALAWPPGKIQLPEETRGYIHLVTGADPAAGSEISETVPTNARWRLLAMTFSLTTDATAVTRRVMLAFDDGSTIYAYEKAFEAQGANLTRAYSFVAGLNHEAVTGIGKIHGHLPKNLILPQGYRIRTTTSNLQAGDNLTAPAMLVEEWLEE